jgi:hypothetical protein
MTLADDALHDLPDRAIRQSLTHPEHLRALLAEAVPDLAPNFDCTRARLLEREFPLDDWRRREADLPFEIPYRVGDTEIFALVFVLIEHQSTVDRWMPLRTLLYTLLYWEQAWKRWEDAPAPKPPARLPPVLPIVLYTGPGLWEGNQYITDLMAEPRPFHAFAPVWRPLFWNLSERTPEQLLASTSEWLQALAVIRAEDAGAEEFRAVYNEAVRRLSALAGRDRVRWYDLLRIVLTWVLWRRPETEQQPLLQAAQESHTDIVWRREVQQMTNKLGETMPQRIQRETRVETLRRTLLILLEDRFNAVSDEVRRRAEACIDPTKLETAIRRVSQVRGAEDLDL